MVAAVVNVTVTNTTAAGFMTVIPKNATSVSLAADVTCAHQTVGNLVVADLGSTAGMVLFNGSNGNPDVVIDVVGYYIGGPDAAAPSVAAPNVAVPARSPAIPQITVRRA